MLTLKNCNQSSSHLWKCSAYTYYQYANERCTYSPGIRYIKGMHDNRVCSNSKNNKPKDHDCAFFPVICFIFCNFHQVFSFCKHPYVEYISQYKCNSFNLSNSAIKSHNEQDCYCSKHDKIIHLKYFFICPDNCNQAQYANYE